MKRTMQEINYIINLSKKDYGTRLVELSKNAKEDLLDYAVVRLADEGCMPEGATVRLKTTTADVNEGFAVIVMWGSAIIYAKTYVIYPECVIQY